MNKRAVVTIISKNYLPFARTLYKSTKSKNKNVDFFAFIVDEDKSRLDISGMQIICTDMISIRNYKQRAMYFDITELNTSVKPDVILHFLENGYQSVIYLDPDIKVFYSLDSIFSLLESGIYDFVLTPHITTPIPDQLFPTEVDILKTGAYNLGFIGVGTGGISIIRWWSNRLENLGFNDTASGLFTDQKWIDLLPGLSDNVFIERGKGFNMAYWNLHERRLEEENCLYTIDHKPLVFFHFSGLDIENPANISRYQNRSNFFNRPDMVEIFNDYVTEVGENTYPSELKYEYKYNKLFNTFEITNITRRLYKRFIEINPEKSESDPFKDLSRESFVAWLIKNRLTVKYTPKNQWESEKILHKAEDLLKNEYRSQFAMVSAIFRLFRRLLGDKRYSDMLQVLSIISNTRRGVIIYDEKIKNR